MAGINKGSESSVTTDIIKRVHLALADLKSGTDVLNFLKATEPVFMDEVDRFIKTEIMRMKYQFNDAAINYVGSVIGAAYIAGFLIAREANHKMFEGLFSFQSDIRPSLSSQEINKIIDKNIDEGKTYKEINKVIRTMLEKDKKLPRRKKKPDNHKKNGDRGGHFKIGDLE